MTCSHQSYRAVVGFDAPRTFGLNCRNEIFYECPSDDVHPLPPTHPHLHPHIQL